MRSASRCAGLVLAVAMLCAVLAIYLDRSLGAGDTPIVRRNPKPFQVFDATLFTGKPDLAPFRIRPLVILYEHRFWPGPASREPVPSESLVRSLADDHKNSRQMVVIDIERWPLKGNAAAVQTTVQNFIAVLSWFRRTAPEVQVGVYGTIPMPDYWRAIRDPSGDEYRGWQQENDRLNAIVSRVDALYPSLYTFYPDRQGWVTYAIAQLREAKRLAGSKPVYAFLWPQYHESNALLGHRPIDPDYWMLQLETVYEYADGAVIWGGWGEKGPEPWDDVAPWWQATKRFLSTI